jgi:hypothetical protein
LTESKPGTNTRIVLHRYDLIKTYENDPEAALITLHQKVDGENDRRDLRFALSELNFLYAEKLENSQDKHKKLRAPDFFLASAVCFLQDIFPKVARRFSESCKTFFRKLQLHFPKSCKFHFPDVDCNQLPAIGV